MPIGSGVYYDNSFGALLRLIDQGNAPTFVNAGGALTFLSISSSVVFDIRSGQQFIISFAGVGVTVDPSGILSALPFIEYGGSNLDSGSPGLPPLLKTARAFAQVASIVNAPLYTASGSSAGGRVVGGRGFYEVSYSVQTSAAGTGTTAAFSLTWTDINGNVKTFTSGNCLLNAVDITGQVNGVIGITIKEGTSVTYSVTVGSIGTSAFDALVAIKQLSTAA